MDLARGPNKIQKIVEAKRFEKISQKELEKLAKLKGEILYVVHPNFDHVNNYLIEYLRKGRKDRLVLIADSMSNLTAMVERESSLFEKLQNVKFIRTIHSADPKPNAGWQKIVSRLIAVGGGKRKIKVGGFFFVKETAAITKRNIAETQRMIQEVKTNPSKNPLINIKTLKEEASIARTIRRAMKMTRNRELSACAGFTTAKLTASGKLKVGQTKRFDKSWRK